MIAVRFGRAFRFRRDSFVDADEAVGRKVETGEVDVVKIIDDVRARNPITVVTPEMFERAERYYAYHDGVFREWKTQRTKFDKMDEALGYYLYPSGPGPEPSDASLKKFDLQLVENMTEQDMNDMIPFCTVFGFKHLGDLLAMALVVMHQPHAPPPPPPPRERMTAHDWGMYS